MKINLEKYLNESSTFVYEINQNLQVLEKRCISELKALSHPHPIVLKVVEALLLTIGILPHLRRNQDRRDKDVWQSFL